MSEGYNVPENSVVYEVDVPVGEHEMPKIVHLTQYDKSIPLLAVRLWAENKVWSVPADAGTSIRMRKPDGKHVYDPVLGFSEDRQTIYIAVTAQMTAAAGEGQAIVEVTNGDAGVIGSGRITMDIARNPVPADAYESTDEYKSLQDILALAEAAQKTIDENKEALDFVRDNQETIQGVPEQSQAAVDAAAAAKKSAEEAAKSEKTATAGAKVVEENQEALQAMLDNLDAVKNAAKNAELADAAAESAATDAARAEAAAKNAQAIAQGQKGYFEDPDALQKAVPEGQDGDWAIIGETDTIWVWDGDSSAWTDSGNKTDLSQYYTKDETDAELAALQTKVEAAQQAADSAGKAAAAAASHKWTVTVAAGSWKDDTTGVEWQGDTLYKYQDITCEGMTADTRIDIITFISGDLESASAWDALQPGDGSVRLWATETPAKDFTLRITEVH